MSGFTRRPNNSLTAAVLGALVSALLAANPVAAATWFVSPSGDDGAGAGNETAPWQTLGKAVSEAGPADVIKVMDDGVDETDDYVENVVIPAALEGLTIERFDSDDTKPHIKSADPNLTVITVEADGVTLKGLEINGADWTEGILFASGTKDGLILQCSSGWQAGQKNKEFIRMAAGSFNHTVSQCEIIGSGNYAIWIQGENGEETNHIIDSCNTHNSFAAVAVEGAGSVQILGLTSWNNTYGLKISDGGGHVIQGSVFDNVQNYVIGLSMSDFNLVADNEVFNSSLGLSIANAHYSVFANNLFEMSSGTGLSLEGGGYNVFYTNFVTGANKAVTTQQGGSSFFTNNIFSNCGSEGMSLGAGGNLVAFNIFDDNGGAGISTASFPNTIFANKFDNNAGGDVTSTNVEDEWRTPTRVSYRYQDQRFHGYVGNLYTSYTGLDDGTGGATAGDGIGDTELPVATNGEGDLYPMVGSYPGDYFLEMFYLAADFMLYQNTGITAIEHLEIPGGESALFFANKAAEATLTFPPGDPADQTSWTYRLSLNWVPPGGDCTFQMGWVDDSGFEYFDPAGPKVVLTNENYAEKWQGAMDAAPLTVPEGATLALRVTNNTPQELIIIPWHSYISPPGPAGPSYPEGGDVDSDISVDPEELALGEVDFGQSYPLQLTVTNTGDSDLTVLEALLSGPDSGEFSVEASSCLDNGPVTLAAQEQCLIELLFAPPAGGDKQASLYIVSDDPALPYLLVPITAHAGPQYTLTAAISPATAGSLSGLGIDCPDDCQEVLDKGTELTLTAATLENTTLTGFEGCDSTNGATCTITLDTDRTVTALFDELLPDLLVEPDSYDFGETYVGVPSPTHLFTLTNVGDWELNLEKVEIAGADKQHFALSDANPAPAALAPGAFATVSVWFDPLAAGDKTADLVITSDDPDEGEVKIPLVGFAVSAPRTLTVAIEPAGAGTVTGEGIDCPGDCNEVFPMTVQVVLTASANTGYDLSEWVNCDQVQGNDCTVELDTNLTVTANFVKRNPKIVVSAKLIDFGEVDVDDSSSPQTITVTNEGNWELKTGQAKLTGLFAEDFELEQDDCSSGSVAAGGQCSITVTFAPGAAKTRAATVYLPSDDPLTPEAAVGLRGWGVGEEPETPGVPVQPEIDPENPPAAAVSPDSWDFGEVVVKEDSTIALFTMTNTGGYGLVAQPSIAAENDDEFIVTKNGCSNPLDAGGTCDVRITFIPYFAGQRDAELNFSTNSNTPVPSIQLTGVGKKKGGGGGCAVPNSAPSSGAALLLLVMVALPFLLRQRASLVVGLALVLLTTFGATSCFDATGECVGSMHLEGTGDFAAVNSVMRQWARATQFDCHEVRFTLEELGPSPSFAFEFRGQTPLWVGRKYGKGTQFTFGGKTCYVAEGAMYVSDVTVIEVAEACSEHVEMRFDLSAMCSFEGYPSFEQLVPTEHRLEGAVRFALDPDWQCPLLTLFGQAGYGTDNLAPEGIGNVREMEWPVEYWGTEVNFVYAELSSLKASADDGSAITVEDLAVTVVPDTGLPGNHFCSWWSDMAGPPPNPVNCPAPGLTVEPMTILLDNLPAGQSAAVTFGDRFSISPTMNWPAPAAGQPVVTFPTPGGTIYNEDPLALVWSSAGAGDEPVIVRFRDGSNDVIAEFEVPDTGSAEVDFAFFGGQTGPAFLEVERFAEGPLELDFPLAAGSSFVSRQIHRLPVIFEQGSEVIIPDPVGPDFVWSEPETLAAGTFDWWARSPRLDASGDGLVYLAWLVDTPAGGGQVNATAFDSLAGNFAQLNFLPEWLITEGPIGVSAGDGYGLVWGYSDQGGGYQPTALLLSSTNSSDASIPSGLDPQNTTSGLSGIKLQDDSYLLIAVGADLNLHYSLTGEPFQYLTGAGDVLSDSPILFQTSATGVVVLHWVTGGVNLYGFDPYGGDAAGVPLDQFIVDRACAGSGVPGPDGYAHFLCPPLAGAGETQPTYARVSLETGALVGEAEPVPADAYFVEQVVDQKLAASPDGSVWAMFVMECDEGEACPLLYHRLGTGEWEGPHEGGEAVGDVDITVDSSGMVHLLYTTPLEPDGVNPSSLYYTMMEVSQ